MLLFIYDKLLTKKEQLAANLDLTFVSYAQMNGKLYWITDTKRKRLFATLPKGKTTSLIFGGIFLLNDYKNNRHKLHAYYNNSMPFTDSTMIEDLYDLTEAVITPIKFNSLQSVVNNEYVRGEQVDCSLFIGNPKNPNIIRNSNMSYYKLKGVDKNSFITLIKENAYEQERLL